MSRLRRLLNRFRAASLRREFDEEIRFHLEQRAARNLGAGMDPYAARAEARRHFGNVTRAREGMQEARVAGWLDDAARDLRHGTRVWRRQPLVTGAAIPILALGIGANAAIFSVLNAVIFRPLPFPDADRLVAVYARTRGGGGRGPTVPEALDFMSMSRTLEGLAFWDIQDVQIDGGAEPTRVIGARVHPRLLSLLGPGPALGRFFTDEDSADGRQSVAILSDGFWRRNFGADPGVIGRTLAVDGVPSMIVGVLPPALALNFLSGDPGIYVPYPLIPLYTSRTAEFAGARTVQVIAHLKRGVDLAAANDELSAITAGLAAAHPDAYPRSADVDELSFYAQSVRESMADSPRPVLWMLFGAVTLVLLIACLNTAHVLLAQAVERQPEVTLRSALGADRSRLVRQFLAETLVLSAAGGAVGVLVAYGMIAILRGNVPVLMVGEIDLDLRVLGFVALVALGTTVLCGLVPGVAFSRVRLRAGLAARGATRRRSVLRQLFVAVEVALSVVLLVLAAQFLTALQARQHNQSGFSADFVTVMRMRGMAAGPSLGQTYARYLERIASVPGVETAAVASSVLPAGGTPFEPIGMTGDSGRSRRATYQIVSPDYFAVARIPMRDGRTFATTDTASGEPVAIVNEALAAHAWPGERAIGHRVRAGVGPRDRMMTIVGVVGNVRTAQSGTRVQALEQNDEPQIYVSYLQQAEPDMTVMVRSRPGGAVPVGAVKAAIWSVEPRQAVFEIRSFSKAIGEQLYGYRVIATLLGAFAALAFVMSVSGIFTVVSYVTTRRVREIAVRRAIGARPSDIVRLLAGQTFGWAAAGLVAGAAASVAASSVLRATIPGLARLDAVLVVPVCATYLAVVALAMTWPALRALRVDPATALRAE
jgi:predicted permease